MELILVLPLPISINSLYVNQFKWDKTLRRRVPTGGKILSSQGAKVKKQIQQTAKKQMKKQEWDYEWTKENYVYLDTIIYFNRKGRDDNNIYKLLNDALEKICYDNDSRVLVRTQRVMYDKKNPRVVVKIHPVKFVGIFKDQEECDAFENKCKTCKRHARNCSILKQAKEGFVQEEINDGKCSKYTQK